MEFVTENEVCLSPQLQSSELKCKLKTFISSSEASYSYSSEKKNNNEIIASHESETKSSKMLSLDHYCRTNILNESDDFVNCEKTKNEFKCGKKKNELFFCEICKEDITELDIYSRAVHMNSCIDKQISSSSTPESTAQQPGTENIFILECPLCFKIFPSPELRSNHIKRCGKSKGLGMQSIIKALELQERHALEREAWGLPIKLIKAAKSHKSKSNKGAAVEPKSKVESDIQLAKALSLSLTNTQPVSVDVTSEAVPVKLRVPSVHHCPGKKNLTTTPLLVLRSENDRKKIMLDKVAAIITLTSTHEDTEEHAPCGKSTADSQEVSALWHLSSKALQNSEYYVQSLVDWIKPSNTEAGTKLCHLSQIAGHQIVTQLPCDYMFSSQDKIETSMELSEVPTDASSSVIDHLCSLVASSWMSDVDIYTACGTVIPAHKLLLAVRCPPLKHDKDFCSSIGRVNLKWENVSFDAALQFLNFVYTGNIEVREDIASDLSHLAEKYKVSDLHIILNGERKTQACTVKSKEIFFQDVDELKTSLPVNSSSEVEVNSLSRSQENMNADLEIVYQCMNSSLKLTQFSTEYAKSPKKSFESESKYQCTESDQLINDIDCEMITACLESKSAEQECSSLHENHHSSSPVIFDVHDSEDDLSHNENSQFHSSQKSSNPCELDLHSAKSNSSDDLIKVLKSTPILSSNLPKNLDNDGTKSKSTLLNLTSPIEKVCSQELSSNIQTFKSFKCQSDFHTEFLNFRKHFLSSSELEDSDENEINLTLEERVKLLNCSSSHLKSKSDSSEIVGNRSNLDCSALIDHTETKNNFISMEFNNVQLCSSQGFSSNTKKTTELPFNMHDKCKLHSLHSDGNVTSSKVLICDSGDSFKSSSSIERTRKNVVYPKATFFSSNNEILPFESSSLHKELSSEMETLPFAGKLIKESKPDEVQDASKTLQTSYQFLDDFLNKEPYKYFEPIVASSEMCQLSELYCPDAADMDENGITEAATPPNKLNSSVPQFHLTDSPVTPFPNYKSMVTPDIKQALQKFGVKLLPRTKAVALLSHIYNETHPLLNGVQIVDSTEELSKRTSKKIRVSRKRKQRDEYSFYSGKKVLSQTEAPFQKECVNLSVSDDISSENSDGERSDYIPEISFSQYTLDSPTKSNKDVDELIKKYILSRDQLYSHILSYTPLNMVEFHEELKNNGIKISLNKLMDFLDEQCITFTCPRKEEYRKKQNARTQRFRKKMIAKMSQRPT